MGQLLCALEIDRFAKSFRLSIVLGRKKNCVQRNKILKQEKVTKKILVVKAVSDSIFLAACNNREEANLVSASQAP